MISGCQQSNQWHIPRRISRRSAVGSPRVHAHEGRESSLYCCPLCIEVEGGSSSTRGSYRFLPVHPRLYSVSHYSLVRNGPLTDAASLLSKAPHPLRQGIHAIDWLDLVILALFDQNLGGHASNKVLMSIGPSAKVSQVCPSSLTQFGYLPAQSPPLCPPPASKSTCLGCYRTSGLDSSLNPVLSCPRGTSLTHHMSGFYVRPLPTGTGFWVGVLGRPRSKSFGQRDMR